MSNIRRLNIFDKSRLKKIAGITGFNEDYFKYNLLKECASPLQGILPLQFKFMPESYVLSENGIIKGLICVSTTQGNPEQINIKRLLFENNDYLTGKKLIKFIIRHYGEKGAKNFKVVVDNKQKDLEQLFINGCGFRCCSYENLWDISHDFNYFKPIEPIDFIPANDDYSRQIAELINSEIITHYQPALQRNENEFKTPLLKFFDNKYENNYILFNNKTAIAFLTIQTNDNYNFIISLTKNNGYKLNYDTIISFALKSIAAKRNSKFKAYLKQNKYLKFAQDYETYLHSREYSCIQTQHVLVKEFYKPIKQEFQTFVFGENKVLSN